MQTRAVIRAAINVQRRHKAWSVKPEIMIPLTCDVNEYKFVRDIVVNTANVEINLSGINLSYKVGTMIEIPRAALTAGEIAEEAEFFCFGTNDLTQMTYGFSRDDAGKFLGSYYDNKIYENDPFARLDQTGVGKLMKMAVTAGEIATEAEFFSFGTNDLTQMTFGFSRDDAGKFLGAYYDRKIYESDQIGRASCRERVLW